MPAAWRSRKSASLAAPFLPTVNACLNAGSAVLLVSGWLAIRSRRTQLHRWLMVSALLCSAAFLTCYLYYHYQVGSVRFQGQGWVRTLYFSILLTHTVLATVIVPMILRALFLAWKQRFVEHARLARWTLPLWLYVSVTGVVVYWMLYRLS